MIVFNNFNPSAEVCEATKALKLMSQIPSKDMDKICFGNPYVVEANHAALFVIERGAINSTLQLVHTINPELQDLGFHSPNRCGILNAQRLEPVYFCRRNAYGALENFKCVIITLPPWEFAPQDFEDFSTMEKVSLRRAYFLATSKRYHSLKMHVWIRKARMPTSGVMRSVCGHM